jgi:hypothetical protein
VTLPNSNANHYVANDPNTRENDEFRCTKSGCTFRVSVRAFGRGEAHRLSLGHLFAPERTVAELVEFGMEA